MDPPGGSVVAGIILEPVGLPELYPKLYQNVPRTIPRWAFALPRMGSWAIFRPKRPFTVKPEGKKNYTGVDPKQVFIASPIWTRTRNPGDVIQDM